MFTRTRTSLVARTLAASAAASILFSASVQAGEVKSVETSDGRIQRSIEVRFVDLDLTTPEGAATLESRLKLASRKVCGAAENGPLHERIDHQKCMTETMASGQRAMVTLVARAEAGESFKPGERIAVGS